MRRKIFYTTLIFIFSFGQVFSQRYKQDEETYRAALELFYIDKDFHSAIKACDEISSRDIAFDVKRLLGKSCIQIGKLTKAEYELNKACETSSKDPMSWYLLGNVRMLLGKFDLAIVNYKNAINILESIENLNVELFPFIEAKGRCYRLKGDLVLAERDIKKSIELGSKYAKVEMANIYLQHDNREKLNNLLSNLKSGVGFGFRHDPNTEAYLDFLSVYAQGKTDEASLFEITLLTEEIGKQKSPGFSVLEYDLCFLKYRMLQQIELKQESYSVLKRLNKLNTHNSIIQNELNDLRIELNIDANDPVISIVYPLVDNFGLAIIQQKTEYYTILGSVEDECELSELSVQINGRAINSIEEGGIFAYNFELHPGDNPIIIDALDGEGNNSRKEFVIKFERNETESTFGPLSIRSEDIPKLINESDFHAVLIAQGNYYDPDFTDLDHPLQDARKLSQILIGLYGFNENKITLLEDQGRSNLLSALDSVSSSLSESDNLLVFYAGHGDAKRMNGEVNGGYIIPADSRYNEFHTYISSNDLFLPFKGCKSKHILFIVDACFGGSLYRATNNQISNQPYINSNRLSSRNLISSGNLEEVPDRSVFIQHLFDCLENSEENVLAASTIYEYIRKNNSTRNVPQHRAIKDYGDKGGMFHFIKDVVSK